jgi:(1->4)-alpha-D-glucan 1-alpha-D-glucosylmutase
LFRAWLKEEPAAHPAVDGVLARVNGACGGKGLLALLNEQYYRLASWKEATSAINYRRFFNINDLAGLRAEDADVFDATHRVILRLFGQGAITGLRIDHPDGLYDPRGYLVRLQQACAALRRDACGVPGRPAYVVVEKILAGDERLRADWPVSGTTGYEFLNLLNGLFVRQKNRGALLSTYRRFTGSRARPERLLEACKRQVLDTLFPAELESLTRAFHGLAPSGQAPLRRDSLRGALRELIASFPVYRTYRSDGRLNPEDRRVLTQAFQAARRKKPGTHARAFAFLQKVLLAQADPTERCGKAPRLSVAVLRLQQLTGPVMAKGLEDTLLYRYFPLVSLNEVGCEPGRFGTTAAAFHRSNRERLANHPHGLSATATHDTKRGEDTRARINVLSEIPRPWRAAVEGWAALNRRHKTTLQGRPVPDDNEEYLIYQTLTGTWPPGSVKPAHRPDYVERIQSYIEKALREAKQHSAWEKPNPAYEGAVLRFVARILDRSSAFVEAMENFITPVARAGYCNSLAQTLLKVAAPGVPDFYQGTEVWDFTLVDPDNRRPTDFGPRRKLLAELQRSRRAGCPGFAAELLQTPEDGRVKLYVTQRVLTFRRAQRDLFAGGAYVPLSAHGARSDHVVAFARTVRRRCAVAVAGRYFMELAPGGLPVGAKTWGDTTLSLPANLATGRYRDIFTGREVKPDTSGQSPSLPLAALFEELPVALLERVAA